MSATDHKRRKSVPKRQQSGGTAYRYAPILMNLLPVPGWSADYVAVDDDVGYGDATPEIGSARAVPSADPKMAASP